MKIVVTKAGAFFLEKVKDYNPLVWSEFVAKTRAYGEPTREGGDAIEIIRDEHEWDAWKVVGDKVLHIEVCLIHKHRNGLSIIDVIMLTWGITCVLHVHS